MADLIIPEALAERLRRIAQQENRTVDEVLHTMLETYTASSDDESLEAFVGAFDDEVSDLSSTVREHMQAYYRQKYGRPG
jgi:lipopolysaccharide biosynthesis regulator YciM